MEFSVTTDLEESLGTLDSTKAVYERMIDLKVPYGNDLAIQGYLAHEKQRPPRTQQ